MDSLPKSPPADRRKTALCYVRLSYTRNENDSASPERQRASIEERCRKEGWKPEWYEDVEGHKSGRYEKNRPNWLKLKERIGDPDVTALVSYDIARLHRKASRLLTLADSLSELGIKLIQTAPGREIDTSTPAGQFLLAFMALNDQAYAEDVSMRQKAAIEYTRAQGKSYGGIPFGTIRNREGILEPSSYGAWLLPNGHFQAGTKDETAPVEGAFWRGYYECAERVLTLYASRNIGYKKVAALLNEAGWAFGSKTIAPHPLTENNIRQITSNWAEYGGTYLTGKAKGRRAKAVTPETVMFKPERALFDLKLLAQVARQREARTIEQPDTGIHRQAFPYLLSGIAYCAHCDRLAYERSDPKLRSLLGGKGGKNAPNKRRYRHKDTAVHCGRLNHSVPTHIVEDEFMRLIDLLALKPEIVTIMAEWLVSRQSESEQAELEQQKQEAIASLKLRITRANDLYMWGKIDETAYRQHVEDSERQIAEWESRATSLQKVVIEVERGLKQLMRLKELFEKGTPDQRQELAQNLFTEVIYDLDTRRIVNFKMSSWANRLLQVSAAYYDYQAEVAKNTSVDGLSTDVQDQGTAMPPRPNSSNVPPHSVSNLPRVA